MLQTDVEELRARLEEKNRLIEKKTQGTLQTVQERNRLTSELTELKDHMEIKDRKINVLQRKVRYNTETYTTTTLPSPLRSTATSLLTSNQTYTEL